MVKHLPAMRETQVQALGWEDTLEKEMATHSSTLAWKIPWTEEPGRLQSMVSQTVRHDWVTSRTLYSLKVWVLWFGPFGLAKLCIGWDFCWSFVCLFVFPLMGKAEWGGNPVSWWFGLYFCVVCCLYEVSCTVCCLYWSGFLCLSSHYVILPRVSSLVV